MRFAVLVVGAVALGAASVGAVRVFVPQNSQMFGAVRALGGDVTNIKLADINPLKAYETVKREITSGDIGNSLNLGPSNPVPAFSSPSHFNVGSKLQIDDASIKRAWASTINNQIQQNNRRMEDMSAYARNPTGWHGLPPH